MVQFGIGIFLRALNEMSLAESLAPEAIRPV